MNQRYFYEADESTVENAISILEEEGLDLQTAIRMFLKRVVKDKSIAFIFSTSVKDRQYGISQEKAKESVEERLPEENLSFKVDRGDMTKNRAIRLFRGIGKEVSNNVTYASKNRSAYNYWANPSFDMLHSDWNIILNDWINRKIYLFTIPADTIAASQLTARSDNDKLIDLQIMYNDMTYTDNRSGYSFANFYNGEIQY